MLVYGQDSDGNSVDLGRMGILPSVGDFVAVERQGVYIFDDDRRLQDGTYLVKARVFECRAFKEHIEGVTHQYRWVCVLKLAKAAVA